MIVCFVDIGGIVDHHCLGQIKKICVFMVTCQKNLGLFGINFFFFFLLSAKPEIVVPGSRIRFQYFIFKISGKPSFIEAVL